MKGENCQYPLGSVEGAITKEFEEGKSSAGVEVFVAVFFSVVGVLALAIYVMVRRRRKQKEQANQEIEKAMSAPTPTSKLSFGEEDLDFGPEKDHEGNELDNVEII
jgi:flagellar biosynthesis/type III secretory pathway M-ring protein FliF/YscJ